MLQDADMQQLFTSLRFIVWMCVCVKGGVGGGASSVSSGGLTANLHPFAQETVADRLAVLAFLVAAVETGHAGAGGVLLSRAFLLHHQVAVWEENREASLKGPRLLQETSEEERW